MSAAAASNAASNAVSPSNLATPANLARIIPAVIGAIVAAVLIIVFFVCCRRRRWTRQKGEKPAPSPLIGGAAPFGQSYGAADSSYNPYAVGQHSDTPSSTWKGRPKSFLDSVKYQLDGSDVAVAYGGMSNDRFGTQDSHTAAMMNRDLASSPTYSNQPQMAQAAVDPVFTAGFIPGSESFTSSKEGRKSTHGPNASVSTTRSTGRRQRDSEIVFGSVPMTDNEVARFSNAEEQHPFEQQPRPHRYSYQQPQQQPLQRWSGQQEYGGQEQYLRAQQHQWR